MQSSRSSRALALLSVLGGALACADEPGAADAKSACEASTWYRDVDGDGHGDAAGPFEACEAPAGHVADNDDCDDQDASVSPAAAEVCNGLDDNCDGTVDEGVDGGDAVWFADTDGDGFGDPADRTTGCTAPEGYVDNELDCDDADPTVSPDGLDEPRDGMDGDCDGSDAISLAERAFVGDATLLSETDVADFCATYDGVVGDLQLAGGGLPAVVDLSCLVEVTGDFVVSADTTEQLLLPSLWWVGGELRIAGNPSMSVLDVPSLRFVDGSLVLLDNAMVGAPVFSSLEEVGELARVDGGRFPVLTEVVGNVGLAADVELNALTVVGGGVTIRDGSLLDVSLPGLVSAGPVELRSVAVRTVVLDALETAASLTIELPALSTELSLAALTTVTGDVDVVASSDVVTAARLEAVDGWLHIEPDGVSEVDLRGLATVAGEALVGGEDLSLVRLESLEAVGGLLWLACPGCDVLDLGQLSSVDGDLTLGAGLALESLDLSNLGTVAGGLALTDAHRLRTLSLPALTTLLDDTSIVSLEYLETVELPLLADPGGEVSIANLPALTSIDLSGLSLGALRGRIVIRDNPELVDLSLAPLASEAGGLTLASSPGITELELPGLLAIGELSVSGAFDTLDLSSLQSTTGDLTLAIDGVDDLELGALEVVGGSLEVSGEAETVDFTALELSGGTVSINLPATTSLDFSSLEQVFTDFTLELNGATSVDLSALSSVGGSALFLRSPDLDTLSLPALTSVGTVTFESLTQVSDLSVPLLATTTGSVEVVECDGITDLDGFSGLTTIGASLTVVGNDLLDDVSGLSGVTSIGSNVRIEDNPSLATSDAEALVESDIGEANIGGGVLITGNAP